MNALIRIPVHSEAIVGTLFLPAPNGRFPGVLVLGGSGGGIPNHRAEALAKNGFAALALGYFGCEGRPPKLVEIPLEYFGTAIEWLRCRPEVTTDLPALVGISRGGELALLIATHFPNISAVVSVSGSGLAHRSPPRNDEMRASWSLRGKPLPYLEENNRSDDPMLWDYHGEPVSPKARYLLNLRDGDAVARAAIPVGHLTAPVLFITGGDDQVWPAFELVELAMNRLKAMRKEHLARHISYPEAGHTIVLPDYVHPTENRYHVIDRENWLYGGTAEADARASVESWNEILRFLRTTTHGGI